MQNHKTVTKYRELELITDYLDGGILGFVHYFHTNAKKVSLN